MTSADFKIYRLPHAVAGIIFLCFVVAVCYAGSIGNGFVSDDHYILELNHDGFGVGPIIKMFLESDTLFNSLSAVPYYRPVSRASYAFDNLLFGLNPAGYHAINIVLHMVCAVLLFLTLLRMGCGMFASMTAATLFGIHPINSEAVNFLSARNNILATAFVLASFLAWLRAEEQGRKRLFSISGFLFFLAILSKETGIMFLPFLLFLKLYDDRQYRIPNTLLTKDLSFIAYHVIFFVVYLLLRSIAIDASFIRDHIVGLTTRMHQLLFILPTYFFLFIAPWRLSFYYRIPESFSANLFPLLAGWATIAAALLVLIWKRDRITIIGLAWVIINFFPISNVLPIPSASMADRYLYLPSIGIALIIGNSLYRLTGTLRTGRVVLVVCLVIGMLLGFQTIKRSHDWKNDLSLSRSIVAKEPSYALGHFDYGYAAYQHGDGQTAAAEFRTAVEIDPRFALASWAYYYLGALHADAGDFSTATLYFRSSVKAEPLNAKSHYALATLLADSDKENSVAEYHQFLNTMHALSLSSVHHLPEVNSIFLLRSEHRSGEHGQGSHRALWKFFHHFPTGTDLYYDEGRLEFRGMLLVADTVMQLAEIDKRSYASRFIRYPLQTAQEAFFTYDICCRQHLYMPTIMEFRDKNNNILSKTYMQKEAEEFFEYAPPGTVMRSFIDTVCAVRR